MTSSVEKRMDELRMLRVSIEDDKRTLDKKYLRRAWLLRWLDKRGVMRKDIATAAGISNILVTRTIDPDWRKPKAQEPRGF